MMRSVAVERMMEGRELVRPSNWRDTVTTSPAPQWTVSLSSLSTNIARAEFRRSRCVMAERDYSTKFFMSISFLKVKVKTACLALVADYTTLIFSCLAHSIYVFAVQVGFTALGPPRLGEEAERIPEV